MTEPEITRLKAELEELREFKASIKRQEEERIITEERLEFSWAGNLGRWSWHYPTGKVVYNRRKVEVLGYDYESFSHTVDAFTSLIHPDDYSETMGAMRGHLTGVLPVYETEYRIRCSDGSYRWFYDRGRITERDGNGGPITVAGIVFDVTAEKERQQELQDTNRKLLDAIAAKDRFFSIIAHDLRTPIVSFISFIRVMQDDDFRPTGDELQELIGHLEGHVRDTDSLLENLLTWSRSQTEGIKTAPRSVDLAAAAAKAIAPLRHQASAKGIRLQLAIPAELVVWADGEILATVIRNLVSNAIKFSPEDSDIAITGAAGDAFATVKVIDHGVGVEPGRLNKLFETSGSLSTAGTQNEKGTGLGLQICKEFVEKNGGTLAVESSEGNGATFSFTVPIASGSGDEPTG